MSDKPKRVYIVSSRNVEITPEMAAQMLDRHAPWPVIIVREKKYRSIDDPWEPSSSEQQIVCGPLNTA